MSRETWIVVGVVVAIVALLTIFGAVRLVIKLISAKRKLGELGSGGKWAFWGAIAYTILPIDLLPDPIYLDDMAVLGGALFYLTKLLKAKGEVKGVVPHGRAAGQLGPQPRAGRKS